jgi:hypothetical protein
VYRIEVQAQINVQVGECLKINKRAVRNKCAGETSCKKVIKCAGLIRCSVMMKYCGIQLSVVSNELEWFLC